MWLRQNCPKDLASALVGAAIYLPFKSCAGVAQVPLLTPDGLVDRPGYHDGTGLILDLRGPPLKVPDAPTQGDAERALERLLRPFRGYLEHGSVSRTAIAAAQLTAVLRPSLPTAPAVLFDGNNPAVGKGKAARALAALATGGSPAVVTEGPDGDELEKRLAAAIVSGSPAILLDNVQRQLASSTLESVLTEAVADIRAFGKLLNLRVWCKALVLVTANNPNLRRDLLRRVLPVRIVVRDDRPEPRSFGFDPVEETLRDRRELLEAAFTVLLAWRRARDLTENEKHRKALGSFEQWADDVAGAVSWLTGENPIDLIDERTSQEAAVDGTARLFAPWSVGRTGGRSRKAKSSPDGPPAKRWPAFQPRIGPRPSTPTKWKGDKPSAIQVGHWLKRKRDAVYGSRILTSRTDLDTNAHLWRIDRVDEGGAFPEIGDAGDDFTQPCEKWQQCQIIQGGGDRLRHLRSPEIRGRRAGRTRPAPDRHRGGDRGRGGRPGVGRRGGFFA